MGVSHVIEFLFRLFIFSSTRPVEGPHALNGGVKQLGPIVNVEAFTVKVIDM